MKCWTVKLVWSTVEIIDNDLDCHKWGLCLGVLADVNYFGVVGGYVLSCTIFLMSGRELFAVSCRQK